MDRAIVERAVRALAAINTGRGTKTRSALVPISATVTPAEQSKSREIAACGSAHCAGCYEVALGVLIHPPKCSEDYRAWHKRWEAKGRVQ